MSMKLKDLRDWINQLPTEFDEFGLVIGERGMYNEEYSYRLDKPVVTFDLDEETEEVIFLHQNISEGKNKDVLEQYPLVNEVFNQPKSDSLAIILELKPKPITDDEKLVEKWSKVLDPTYSSERPNTIILEAQERQLTDDEMKERYPNGTE